MRHEGYSDEISAWRFLESDYLFVVSSELADVLQHAAADVQLAQVHFEGEVEDPSNTFAEGDWSDIL